MIIKVKTLDFSENFMSTETFTYVVFASFHLPVHPYVCVEN